MKIRCQCGFIIVDGTDELPQKAHLIPEGTAIDREILRGAPKNAG